MVVKKYIYLSISLGLMILTRRKKRETHSEILKEGGGSKIWMMMMATGSMGIESPASYSRYGNLFLWTVHPSDPDSVDKARRKISLLFLIMALLYTE